MANIINPYRFVGEGPSPGGDYVTITVDSLLEIEDDMYDSDYKYFVVDSTLASAFTVTDAGSASGSDTIEVYLIAGGGGGGAAGTVLGVGAGAGGGAGGYLRELAYDNGGSLAQTYNVTIAGGAAGGTAGGGDPNDATSGDDSQLEDTAYRSLDINGTDEYITLDSHSDWNFGSSDFTIETWINFSGWNSGGFNTIAWIGSVQLDYKHATNQLRTYVYHASGNSSVVGTWDAPTGSWHHVAVVRNGDDLKLYLDGNQLGSTTDVSGITLTTPASSPSAIGARSVLGGVISPDRMSNCLIAGFKISSTARYTGSTYDVPFEVFNPSAANTEYCMIPKAESDPFKDRSSGDHDYSLINIENADDSSDFNASNPWMRAFGGGKGGGYDAGLTSKLVNPAWGADGGSGGGSAYYHNPTYSPPIGLAGSGIAGQGNDGGVTPNTSTYVHGGGGGAGSVGADGGSGTGNGGDGAYYEWMEDTYNSVGSPDGDGYFAGGGGGGRDSGNAGSGGGGDGNGGDGSANSGGGGGGGNSGGGDGGNGGGGYLIIRWKYRN